jgi:hypothetical protein
MTESPPEPVRHSTGLDIWAWSANNPPPGAGQFASDSGNWTSVVTLSIANQDSAANDATTKLSGLQVGDTIRAEFDDDANSFHEWTTTGTPVSGASWFDIPVADGTSGGSAASDGKSCKLTFTSVAPPDGGGGLAGEPMYGPEDVARAVHTSGKRALASAYYTANNIQWLNKDDAMALVAAIDSGQPLQGVTPTRQQAEPAAAPSEQPQGGSA